MKLSMNPPLFKAVYKQKFRNKQQVLLRSELQLNKANTTDKETSFLDLNKVIDNDVHTTLCPKSPSARGLVASLPVRLLFKSI